jgi:hypothetical protein
VFIIYILKLATALHAGYAVCENSTEDMKLLVIEGIIEECLYEDAGVVLHEKMIFYIIF